MRRSPAPAISTQFVVHEDALNTSVPSRTAEALASGLTAASFTDTTATPGGPDGERWSLLPVSDPHSPAGNLAQL